MKELMAIIVIGTLILTLTSISTSLAENGAETTTTTTSASNAERAATDASMAGISTIAVEGAIFATAIVFMAIAISSDSIEPSDQGHGHGHGHGH